jgi:hypothetical protein
VETLEDLPAIPAIPAPTRDRDVRPQWKCFCCCDSGKVSNPYLKRYVQGENGKPFICQRPSCEAGKKYRTAYYLSDAQRQEYAKKHGGEAMTQQAYQSLWDMRLTVPYCERMHTLHKQDWERWASDRVAKIRQGQLDLAVAELMHKQQMNGPIARTYRV